MFPHSIRARLFLAFGTLATAVLLVATMAWTSLAASNERFEQYVHGINARATTAASVRSAVDRRAVAIRNLLLASDAADAQEERSKVLEAHADVGKRLEVLQTMAKGSDVTQGARDRILAIAGIESVYGPIAVNILKLVDEGHRDQALVSLMKDCRPNLAALVKASDDYLGFTHERESSLIAAAEASHYQQRMALGTACVLSVALAVIAGFLITRNLLRALGAEPAVLHAAADRIASGDLREVEGLDSAAAGSVLRSLAAMQKALANIVNQVREASESIATGSSQIATGNTDLSQRTEVQASSLQQTAASMEQMTASVQQNRDTVVQALKLAASTTEAATHGGQVVEQVAATMGEITSSSNRIADIIGVIDGIAFQTNILALNAAVEAARAGEQGRGFAVVAGEVRALAQRSAEAAREIKTLITASVQSVQAGAELVGTAGSAMQNIVDQVRRTTDLIDEISTASLEQHTGIGQVGSAISELDRTTQQNAALVEESAAAADALHQQAQRLAATVRVFQLAAA